MWDKALEKRWLSPPNAFSGLISDPSDQTSARLTPTFWHTHTQIHNPCYLLINRLPGLRTFSHNPRTKRSVFPDLFYSNTERNPGVYEATSTASLCDGKDWGTLITLSHWTEQIRRKKNLGIIFNQFSLPTNKSPDVWLHVFIFSYDSRLSDAPR